MQRKRRRAEEVRPAAALAVIKVVLTMVVVAEVIITAEGTVEEEANGINLNLMETIIINLHQLILTTEGTATTNHLPI